MARLTASAINSLLARDNDRFVMLTHGEGFALDDGRTIDRRVAQAIIPDLFSTCDMRHKPAQALEPCEDGLFPGFSQTWRNGNE